MESKESVEKKKRPVLITLAKILMWILGSVVFLIILVLILIQTAFVQNFARKKVVSYLEHKLKTKVEIGKLDVKFPTAISLQNVFFEDQTKDTLLYGGEIKVNIDMFKLISKNIEIKEIALNNIVLEVKRLPPDSVFNFQFIVDAFTSEQKSTPSKDTTALKMNIDEILVNKTRIVYKDAFTGNDMDLTFGHLDTKISKFDPSHLLFNIPSITLKGLTGYFYQLEPLKKSIEKSVAEAAAPPEHYLQLQNKEINLSGINVNYKSAPSHMSSSIVIENAVVHPKTIDLKNSIVTLNNISLENSNIALETNSKAVKKKPVDTTVTAPTPSMKIISGDITVKNINLKYDDSSAPKAPSGMDFSHLDIKNFGLNISSLNYSSDTILASVKSASMQEKSGFVLNDLITDFSMVPSGVSLQNLLIQTPGSEIKKSIAVSYPSLDAIKKNMGMVGLDINLENTKIAVKDIQAFMPSMKSKMSSLPANSSLYVDTRITGKLSDLNLQKLILKGLSATDINVNGTIKGMPDSKKLSTDLSINKLQTSKQDILAFVPQKSLPKSISLPERLAVSGKVSGGMNDLYMNVAINTSSGNAKVNGTLQNITDKHKAHYDVVLNAGSLQLGSIMKNPKLGVLTGNFIVKGNGYDPKTANATFDAVIPVVTYNNYTYHNLKAAGSIANQNYKINASARDPNLDLAFSANGSFSGKYPTADFVATIDSIKTLPLHFTTSKMIYHGDIAGNFTNVNPDSLAGNLVVTHSILVNDSQRITLDSAQIIADNSPGNQSLSVKTDFLSASIAGTYKLTQLADVFKQAINPYFAIGSAKDTVKVDPYHFTVTAGVVDNPALHAFLPSVTSLKPINLSGNFASDSGWNLAIRSPHIVYGTMVIDSVNFNAGTKNGALAFNTSLRRFESGKSLNIYATTLDGTLQNNKLDFTLTVKDNKSKNKYRLSGMLNQPASDKYVFSLKPDSLLLNYNKWTVNADNQIQYFNKDINAHNFILTQGNQHLSINSTGTQPNSPMQLSFQNFKIETLTGFVQSDSLMVNGLLNGNATVKNIQTQPTFTTDLSIDSLSIYNDTIGRLTAKVNNNVANTYHADVSLSGRGNEVNINGDYVVKPVNSSYDFVVDIVTLQMKALEGFTKGALKDATGNMYGKIALNGSLKNPNIDGRIQFNNTAFNVTMLNNVFKIDKSAIAIINNKGIELNKFTIRDEANNAIIIDGAVNTPDFFNYTFNLKINAQNFQAINSTNKDNKLFYGKMVFSTRLTVTGTPTHPVVDGDLTINDKTDFTVVLPQQEPGVEKREGIVRFVDMKATAEDSLFMAPYDSLKKSALVGYDVSLNINIDKNAIFNMIVDAANGDFLKLKGTGQLTAGIDASGKITLVGSYEIDEGTYNLSFNFLKRKFNIQKGSRIVWTGEPTTAQLNVTAIYIANTAPIDLVQDQLAGTNTVVYKQKLPFEVHLLLEGELLKPVITFDIILPENKNYNVSKDVVSTVETRLAQLREENGEMNKQVFALLLLNRFVGEDPFSSSGGSMNAGTFAMQSVSRLLSEQLNDLATNLVQGVDINFDLATTQDYTTGTEQNRTDLNVGVTKRLLSDRLTVTVGSDFELQGPMQTNQQASNLAGNISVNYKLSKDGRYMLRAYRKNDYTEEIEGYVIETGLAFVISADYNRFKELFSTKEQRRKKREIKKQNKEINKEDNTRLVKEKEEITPPVKATENDK
ncbi:MAG TPA: translocation/assembly module TamB domain-containing protein [Hanamia sp.]|nr:translocation/assembly module TamB domain-containing protein [Hanamia sp.]